METRLAVCIALGISRKVEAVEELLDDRSLG